MGEYYRQQARSARFFADRERNPDIKAMLKRNVRAFYKLARMADAGELAA